MTYLYKERCLNTVEELYQFFAADCPLVSNGYTVTCAPTSMGVDITLTDPVTTNTFTQTVVPPAITCPDFIGDAIELSWLVVGVLVSAWGFRVLYNMVRR